MYRLHVHIKGTVQGVGFRPFVYALASAHGLTGWVINDSNGVEIEVDSETENALREFLHSLMTKAPPLAVIIEVTHSLTKVDSKSAHKKFEIRKSREAKGERVLISPDVAVCEACLKEMYDPKDRRYRYPFLNCTNCGPRFTIIKDVPYDRPLTTMASFDMCEYCTREYKDPENRRFHAQPVCCPVCGPRLEFLDGRGQTIDGDPLELTIEALHAGKTVAIKGIGGFHLACDAKNTEAVRRLRQNKHREAKPLAIMTGGISSAKRLAVISPEDEQVLLSPVRPILVLPERENSGLPSGNIDGIWGVTGGTRTVGIMLPYAPLHHLFFRPIPKSSTQHAVNIPEEIGGTNDPSHDSFAALVMTSGNLSDEPIAVDNNDALNRLKGIADAFLIHNRDIYRRCDDSVVSSRNHQVWRLGRGYSPRPVFLPRKLPSVLGVGAEDRVTVCHLRGDKAFISPHIGDLKTFEAYEFFKETIEHQRKILDTKPDYAACDLHPDYHSTRWAEEKSGLPVIKVQHHHAHVVALMAEHNCLDEKIIGLAMDGTGLGDDGAIWGGEVLLCTPTDYERLGHFNYAPLPGGDTAIKEVWRAAYARLRSDNGLPKEYLKLFEGIPFERLEIIEKMIITGTNAPDAGSLGRLFDSAAFVAGIGSYAQYDGQFPMLLEAECLGTIEDEINIASCYPESYITDGNDVILADGSKIIRDMTRLRLEGWNQRSLARWFHKMIIEILFLMAFRTSERTGVKIVGLTGGCFMNRILSNGLTEKLIESGIRVLEHKHIPPNDACISLGQAVSGGYRLLSTNSSG